MPEGDTIFRAARTLHRALAGRTVTTFESVYPALTRVDASAPVVGRTVEAVSSRGKHLLMTFSGALTLHTHMRMNGSWHIYRSGERWRAPHRDMRIVIGAGPFVAVGFNIPVAEFLTPGQLARHAVIQSLGPDLTDPAFNRSDVLQRISERPHEPIAEVLLDQRILSGIGNVLKSEILFVARIDPLAPAGTLDDRQLDRILDVALRLMTMNTVESLSMTRGSGRRTTGSLDPSAKLYVYGRGGKPCRQCGTLIRSVKTGLDARLTYWCPHCQPAAGEGAGR
jgi:endonuclease-8